MRHRGGRPGRTSAWWVVLGTLALGGCDFLDPTNVENPRTTTEDLAQADEPTRALLPGLRAQFARVVSSSVVIAEVVSDNFSIHGTGLDGQYDDPGSLQPSILNGTGAATGNYWNLQELRALASFLLDDIIPGDDAATAAQRAEVLYYRGMALVMLGENFTHAPLERDGLPIPADDLITGGIADLQGSIAADGNGDFSLPARAGIARGERLVGNSAAAVQAAGAALATEPEFVFLQEFDASNLANQPYFFLVERQLQEMQPLPRLDFLDPKFTTRETGIPVAKAEEMHLILAEAALAGGNFSGGLGHLSSAIRLARSRSRITYNDADPRLNANLSIRPRSASIRVRADADSPFRAGLVLGRPGPVQFSPISGSSLDADSVAALPVAGQEAIWHAFHLARQEILFLEGRRMSDLGIRLPMMLREIDTNVNISPGDPGTVVVVPGYLPPTNEMDRFTPASPYDANENLTTTEVTILHDLNRILARNRVTPFN